jgi:hypothetical protein
MLRLYSLQGSVYLGLKVVGIDDCGSFAFSTGGFGFRVSNCWRFRRGVCFEYPVVVLKEGIKEGIHVSIRFGPQNRSTHLYYFLHRLSLLDVQNQVRFL